MKIAISRRFFVTDVVAVNHAAAVRKVDRVTDLRQHPQKPLQRVGAPPGQQIQRRVLPVR